MILENQVFYFTTVDCHYTKIVFERNSSLLYVTEYTVFDSTRIISAS